MAGYDDLNLKITLNLTILALCAVLISSSVE